MDERHDLRGQHNGTNNLALAASMIMQEKLPINRNPNTIIFMLLSRFVLKQVLLNSLDCSTILLNVYVALKLAELNGRTIYRIIA